MPLETQDPQVPQMPSTSEGPQSPLFKGDMTNTELRDALINLTQLVMAQDHVVNNHFVA